jgi:antirestriction protein ArdC
MKSEDIERGGREQEIAERLKAATDGLTYIRYEHGGGRAYREADPRLLAIDAYNEADREFYFSALDDIRHLLAELTRVRAERDELKHWMGGDIKEIRAAESELERLKQALEDAKEDIHSEYCGMTYHHEKCLKASAALAPQPQAAQPTIEERLARGERGIAKIPDSPETRHARLNSEAAQEEK